MFSATSSAAKRRLSFAILLGSLCTFGCEPNKPQEVTAESSGYLPKDAAGKQEKPAKESTASQAPANTPVAADPQSATPLADAPELPDFSPGKADAELAKKSFMQLKLPADLTSEEALLKYLADNTQATRELVMETQRKQLTQEAGIHRALELGRDKIKAAEALAGIAKNEETIQGAIIAKFEALTQMASLGDVISADDLHAYSQEQSESKYPKVAEQATALLLSLGLSELTKDLIKVEDFKALLEKAYKLQEPGIPTLRIVEVSLDGLREKTGEPQTELAKRLDEMFKNAEDNQLSIYAFRTLLQHTPSYIDFETSIAPNSPILGKPAEIEAKLKALLEEVPNQLLPLFILSQATNIEYSGRTDTAKVLVDGAASKIESIQDEKIRDEVKVIVENFQKRLGVLGSAIDFSGLAELDGQAFDFAKQYAGKIVVIDFWATWCGPCLNEIPNLENMLQKHQADGVEVLGINLDDPRERLDEFLKATPLPWKSVVSSNKEKLGFETEIAQRLGINAIPFVAIIDRDGKVAAVHARGTALEQKVAELIAKGKVGGAAPQEAVPQEAAPESQPTEAEPTEAEPAETEPAEPQPAE